MLGRRGTGKRFLLDICRKLVGANFATSISEAIIGALEHKKMVLVENVEGKGTNYEEFLNCQIDKDI